MSFRLVPKSVTLNGVMAVALRYFSDFGNAFQHITASISDQQRSQKFSTGMRQSVAFLPIYRCSAILPSQSYNQKTS